VASPPSAFLRFYDNYWYCFHHPIFVEELYVNMQLRIFLSFYL
jgi:hypothetical protein